MSRFFSIGVIVVATAVVGASDARAKPPTGPAPATLPPLPILPSVARVIVTSHGTSIAVTEEVTLPRGEWKGEALSFHIAFGAPGPKAIDAHLVPVGDGALEPDDDEVGEALTTDRVPRRPGNAYALLGRESMAGIVVHVKAESLKKALERGNMASLRIRYVADVTTPDQPEDSVVVRLGASRGTPLTLGRIVAGSIAPALPLAQVDAKLCGAEADTHPLAVTTTPKLVHPEPTIAPVLSVRHASDDLCIRLIHAPK